MYRFLDQQFCVFRVPKQVSVVVLLIDIYNENYCLNGTIFNSFISFLSFTNALTPIHHTNILKYPFYPFTRLHLFPARFHTIKTQTHTQNTMQTFPQIIRDLGFMIPDIFHFIIPIWLLRKTRRENYSTKPFYRDHKLRRDIIVTAFIVAILLLICSML